MNFLSACDGVLRGQFPPMRASLTRLSVRQLLLIIGACGLLYGAVMGAFALKGGLERAPQLLFSALKVPLLLGVTGALCLPSFWVLNTLLGLRDDWPRVMAGLLATQAASSLVLAALCPFTLLCYASSDSHTLALGCNALMFASASLSAQKLLGRYYGPLVRRDPRHAALLKVWLLLYALIGVQMGWVLRPFVGDLNSPLAFFRPDAWSNAYEVVARLGWDLMRHGSR